MNAQPHQHNEFDELQKTVDRIACELTDAETAVKALASRVMMEIQEMYAEATQQLIEHAIYSTFAQVSHQVRDGETVELKDIGILMPAVCNGKRVVVFHPAPILTQTRYGEQHPNLIRLADRRQTGGA